MLGVFTCERAAVMRWQKNKMGATFTMATILASTAIHAAPVIQSVGQVNMQGEIMDSACTISMGSHDQTITIDTTLLAGVIDSGQGSSKTFSIALVNCVLVHNEINPLGEKRFHITFDGKPDGEHFSLWGEGAGVALQLNDKFGNTARPGQPLPLRSVHSESKRLDYDFRLIANNQTVRSGSYFSAVRFKLDYF
ncbi:MAG: fimbrial protein [Enterobacterales bacterium]|uniref:fimbrial protein n=1 Tax=Serratia sp. (in: enterobacteria) TaxID=616 RepID=UPI003F2A22A2